MICPQCHAEYRPGFTQCADCCVALVGQLPASTTAPRPGGEGAMPGTTEDDPFCAFWEGDDPRIYADLAAVLDEAGIPHNTVRRQDYLFHLSAKNVIKMGVPFSLFEKAEAAVKEAFGCEEATGMDTVKLLSISASVETEELRTEQDEASQQDFVPGKE